MADKFFIKISPELLRTADAEAVNYLSRIKVNSPVLMSAKAIRNSKFHRKMLALLRFAFDNKEFKKGNYLGQEVEISFDRFRSDMVVWAGFFRHVANIKGEVRYEADSISYEHCDQEKAERIYSALLDVVGTRLFNGNYTRDQLDEITDKYLNFV